MGEETRYFPPSLLLSDASSQSFNVVGDIVYTSIVGRPIIILNSLRAADDILVERSVLNSDRPKSTFSGDMYVYVTSL